MRTTTAKKAIMIMIVLCLFSVPLLTHADTISDLRVQLIALLQQLVSLLEQQLLDARSVSQGTSNASSSAPLPTADVFVSGLTKVSCSMSVLPTYISAGQSATLSWTSEGATAGAITSLGTVVLNSSQTVTPSATATYLGSFTGSNGVAYCTATLTVLPNIATIFNATTTNGTSTSSTTTAGASCTVHRHCGDLVVPDGGVAGNSKACGVVCAVPQQCVHGAFVDYGTYATPHQYETSCPDDPYSL